MKIRYYIKHVYGTPTLYPIDYAQQLMTLTGCKTLREKDMSALKAMGFEFEQVFQELFQAS